MGMTNRFFVGIRRTFRLQGAEQPCGTGATALRIERCEDRNLLAAPQFADGEVMGTVELSAISAASGLIASRQNADVLWTHNDNGDSRLFALDDHGQHLGIYSTGVPADDWEDLALGPGPIPGLTYLYIADTGDNAEARSEIVIYRAIEPDVSSDQQPTNEVVTDVDAIRLRYPDEPHDAETLIVDPLTADIYLVTKRDTRSRIYRAAYPQSITEPTTLVYIAELSWSGAASGDISPDGDEIILKNLGDVYYYARPSGTTIAQALAAPPESLPYTTQSLGEGLTFDSAGEGYFTNSEGSGQALYYYARLTSPTADLTGDGIVDRSDAAILARNFGLSPATVAQGDIDGNGVVALSDLVIMQSQFTADNGSQAASMIVATPVPISDGRPDYGTRIRGRASRAAIRTPVSDLVFTAGIFDEGVPRLMSGNRRIRSAGSSR